MKIGGPKPVTDAIKASGGSLGPRSKWLGSWAQKSGIADWDSFFASCKADGVDPLVLFWYWGDDISPAAITNGVQDRYQGVWKTQAIGLDLITKVMEKAAAAGVAPLVTIENEFNKNGAEKSTTFASYFDAAASKIRAACPAAKIIFAPGAWGDLAALATFYAAQISKTDMIGTQSGFFLPRNPSGNLATVGTGIANAFAKLGTTKPRILYDVFLSTYGGAYQPSHPFAGGDGRALEAQQAQGITSLGNVPNLTALVYRSIKDDPTFAVSNYGGYAERYVGVSHSDGTQKPGYASLLALAKLTVVQPPPTPTPTPTPVPATYTQAQMDAVTAERDNALQSAILTKGTLEIVQSQLDVVRQTILVLQDSISKLQAQVAADQARLSTLKTAILAALDAAK